MVLVATSYFGRPIKQEDRNIVTKIEWKNVSEASSELL
jgi:hypothetical protein